MIKTETKTSISKQQLCFAECSTVGFFQDVYQSFHKLKLFFAWIFHRRQCIISLCSVVDEFSIFFVMSARAHIEHSPFSGIIFRSIMIALLKLECSAEHKKEKHTDATKSINEENFLTSWKWCEKNMETKQANATCPCSTSRSNKTVLLKHEWRMWKCTPSEKQKSVELGNNELEMKNS